MNMRYLIGVLLTLTALVGCSSLNKASLDSEVSRLCAIDGGLKVYETVALPVERFNSRGQINFFRPTRKENALGDEYIYQVNEKHYINGTPTLNPSQVAVSRIEVQVIRKNDMKVLGMFVRYARAGGDPSGPWMPSSFKCPDESSTNEIALFSKIFIEGERK